MPEPRDPVVEARRVLKDASRIHALHDSDPKKDEDVSWLVEALANENTALREQLAHRTVELENESREMQKWNNRANQLAIEGQELRRRLAQVEKERSSLRKALDDWAGGVLTQRELIGKLQQVTNWQSPEGWIKLEGGTGPVVREQSWNTPSEWEKASERLKQIRERRHAATLPANQRGLLPTASWVDIDFLLSLLDSQAPRPVHRNYECFATVADETLWCPTCACRAEYLRGHSDAATRMRNACVAKVKDVFSGTAVNCTALIAVLESLTLDAANSVKDSEREGVEDDG